MDPLPPVSTLCGSSDQNSRVLDCYQGQLLYNSSEALQAQCIMSPPKLVFKPEITISHSHLFLFFFLSEPQIILPLTQFIKSEICEISLILSSSHNLNPGSLFSPSPISYKSTGVGPLSTVIVVKHKFACVTPLLKSLQNLPNPCSIKSSIAHKAHMT